MVKLTDKFMKKSIKINYKSVEIYSDGCLHFKILNILKVNKKIFLHKKDYKLFQKLLKKKLSVKKKNNYRNKILNFNKNDKKINC